MLDIPTMQTIERMLRHWSCQERARGFNQEANAYECAAEELEGHVMAIYKRRMARLKKEFDLIPGDSNAKS